MSETRSPSRRRLLLVAALAAAGLLVCWLLLREADTPSAARNGEAGRAARSGEGAESGAADSRRNRAATGRRTAASSPLPPPGTPLVQIYDELEARADAGDAAAASRLYREVRGCFRARTGMLMLQRSARMLLNQNTSNLKAHQLQDGEDYLARLERELQQARATSAGCAGLSEAQLQLDPLTFRAAQLGDADASACYVSGAFLFAGGGLLDHPEWLARYKSNALRLVQAGIEQGNWQMVMQLRAAYGGEPGLGPLGELVRPDPVQNYRYLKLQWLASPASVRAQLTDELAEAAGELPGGQLADADAWAGDAFVRYFGGQPKDDLTDLSACHD